MYAQNSHLLEESTSCLANCTVWNMEALPGQKDVEDTERMISKDLYGLPADTRQQVYHDIHGVSDQIEEDHEMVTRCKAELCEELMKHKHQNPSFELAWQEGPEYVSSLFLMFLRCEQFRVKHAAQRMYLHFEMKRELFGDAALARDIELASDFDKNDMACLKVGFLQLLPERDRSGRVIVCKVFTEQKFRRRENAWRTLWYILMQGARDPETQRRGMVTVLFAMTDRIFDLFDRQLFRGIAKCKAAIPVRSAAAHWCFSNPMFGSIIQFVTRIIQKDNRTRTKLHQGSYTEVQYDLLSYGIPVQRLPVSHSGKFRTKEYLGFVKARMEEETSTSPQSGILIPSNLDVLFGKGKVLQQRPGNMRLAMLLEDHMDEYLESPRAEKMDVIRSILEKVKESGGRFLRQDTSGVWLVVNDKDALAKVGHGLRNRKPRVKKQSMNEKVPTSKRSSSPEERPSSVKDYITEKRFKFAVPA